jgi:hypothetical protein
MSIGSFLKILVPKIIGRIVGTMLLIFSSFEGIIIGSCRRCSKNYKQIIGKGTGVLTLF